MKFPSRTLVGLAALSVLVPMSRADVLANFDFQSYLATDDAPYASVDTNTDSVAGGFSIGSGLGGNGSWNTTTNGIDTTTGSPAPAFAQKGRTTITTQAQSYTADAFWSFTLTPSAGFELDLTSLTFDLRSVSTGPTNFQLTSSLTGFNNAIGAVTSDYANSAFTLFSYDLTGASFQNVSTPVEFRLYLWWNVGGGGSSGSASRWDDVILNGDVMSVPEPSVSLLAGLGAMVFFWRRRPTLGLRSF